MRTVLSLLRCISPLCLSLALPLLFAGPVRGQTTPAPNATPVPSAGPVQIDYTGSLMGYYRMEYGETDHLPPVTSFLQYRQDPKQKPNSLLLGMGDNFGPEFGASLQLVNDGPPAPDAACSLPPNTKSNGGLIPRPESLYKDDDRVAKYAHCDNVLNFLMQAGFRAIVPGTQDFMYTARWLRVSALLLSQAYDDPKHKPPINKPDHKLSLLGANLRIAMKNKGGAQESASGGAGRVGAICPLLFSPNPFDEKTVRCVADGQTPEPLDWLNRLDRLNRGGSQNATGEFLQQLAAESSSEAGGWQSELDEIVHDEISILQSAWGLRLGKLSSSNECDADSDTGASQEISKIVGKGQLVSGTPEKLVCVLNKLEWVDSPDNPAGPTDRAEFQAYRDRLTTILENYAKRLKDPKANLGDCAQDQNKASGGCFLLSPEARAAAINGLLRTITIEEKDIGYTVAHPETGRNVLIVGVVGQDTMDAVSETNLDLCLSAPPTKHGPKARGGAGAGQPEEHFNAIDAIGACGDRTKAQVAGNGTRVMVSDPVSVTQALVRGANLLYGPFDGVVVMAQMPHTQAEILSERVWKQLNLVYKSPLPPPFAAPRTPRYVDAVLSEAESGYGTQELTLTYPASAQGKYPAPVVTPDPSYSSRSGRYPGEVSSLTIENQADGAFSINNNHGVFTPSAPGDNSPTTISLLYQLIASLRPALSSSLQKDYGTESDLTGRQKTEFALLEDLQKASMYKVDVVLLQSRDVELDTIGTAYTGYVAWCNDSDDHPDFLCRFHVALDRIFWKGDYLEYVAVTGKTLTDLLGASEQKMAEQAQLADTGPTGGWLISFGIVQSALTNLTEINENNEPVWIPVDPTCKGTGESQSTYCIGGTPVVADAYYWVLTTDQLAEDRVMYGTLNSLPGKNHKRTDIFVTAPLSRFLERDPRGFAAQADALVVQPTGAPAPSTTAVANSTETPAQTPKTSSLPQALITKDNVSFQRARLFQVDFAKVIGSFTSRRPVGGDTFVQNFQGVSDSRASAPASQDLDLEMGSRFYADWRVPDSTATNRTAVSVGLQSAFTYNRAAIGNLLNKPINPSYSLNNWTEGAFLQVRLFSAGDVRSLPRNLLVFTPHQYQIEVDNPYLFFTFSPSAGTGEFTVMLPRTTGWTDRAGFREEFGRSSQKAFWWSGSYFETGMEFNDQNNVLSSITLQDGPTGTPKTCPVQASITLQTCFTTKDAQGAALTINGTTMLVGSPAVESLHSPGVYWQIHLQNRILPKKIEKQISLVTDTQGDYYFGRPPSAELASQTEYAIPLSISLVLPSIGNLSFAPSYSAFFYEPQVSSNSLIVNSFSLTARWYFARDYRVPVHRQAPLSGPESSDQTKTGSAH